MSESRCELCGHPMPVGEEMFSFHGYSGPCPAPPVDACHQADDYIEERGDFIEETTITRTYLRNKTKDEIIEHVMRLLSENDKLAAENLCWKGCTNNVRAVCEQAGYATRFGQDGVHVIGGTGIPRDLVDPVVEMATDLKQTRDALESLLFAVRQEPAMNNKKYAQLELRMRLNRY